jgi:hypothetical protein
VVGVGLLVGSSRATAAPILQETLFNLNGTTYHNTFAVPGLNAGAFDGATGLGTLHLVFTPGVAGVYHFDAFFDHQLHVPFYDEFGQVGGAPGAGISWQIDEPGFGDANRLGTIFTNTTTNSLDNTNHVAGTTSNFLNDCGANTLGHPVDPSCNNDVSLAMGFNFILAADEQALIALLVSEAPPTGGFFLRQVDPGTPSAIYLTGSIEIGPRPPVPEPTGLVLMATMAGLARRVWRAKTRPA